MWQSGGERRGHRQGYPGTMKAIKQTVRPASGCVRARLLVLAVPIQQGSPPLARLCGCYKWVWSVGATVEQMKMRKVKRKYDRND